MNRITIRYQLMILENSKNLFRLKIKIIQKISIKIFKILTKFLSQTIMT
jgi:hypothetical protein